MLKRASGFIKKVQFTEKSVPWILLLACILAFGLLIPKLGYFQDDWNYVFNYYSFGSRGLAEFLDYDGRPFAAWVYDAGFKLLGFFPLYWHITELLLRWMTGYILWLVLRILWPNLKWQALAGALLFLLYPFFTLQPLAVAYTLHWTGYLLFSLSMYFMLRAQTNRFWLFTTLALITQAAHLFTLEFYSGIDLLRPVFLWVLLSKLDLSVREKLKLTLRKWLPYLVIFSVFFVWRGFIYQAAKANRNAPSLFANISHAPLQTTVSLILNGIPDLATILISPWYKLIAPDNLDFSNSTNIYLFLISLLSFGIFLFILFHQNHLESEDRATSRQFFLVGCIALIFSLMPIYVSGYVIHTKLEPWNSRLSLGSLLGAAMIMTGVVDYLIKVPRTRWMLLAVLIGLLIGWHVRYTNDFRWAWDKQVNFYRQLYLRAPEIKPGTAILSEEEFLSYMGDYPTSYGINVMYTKQGDSFEGSRKADYWFFPYINFYTRLDQYLNGQPFSATRAGTSFQGEPEGTIVISFEPDLGQCLWVMRPEYESLKSLSQTMRQLVSISYVDRIEQAPLREDSFVLKYLYLHPEQDWCYYYEKADLAYQYEEWAEVLQLWKSARQSDLRPDNGFEYLPFIEAYAHADDWKTAESLTLSAQKIMRGIDPLFCDTWSKLKGNTPESPEKDEAVATIQGVLHCDQ